MNKFNQQYQKYVEAWSGGYGSIEGDTYIKEIEEAIKSSTQAFQTFMSSNDNKGIDYLKGDIAEYWHAETLKIDSIIKGDKSVYANVPRNRGPIDVSYGDMRNHLDAQLKYYKSAEDTAKAISNHKFDSLNKIVPNDQIDDVKFHANRLAARNADIRPDQAQQYEDTVKRVSDQLNVGRSSSTPLSEKEAKQLAKDLKDNNYDPNKYGLNSRSLVSLSDIARQSGEAALHAILISAVIKAGPQIYQIFVESINKGEIDLENIRTFGCEVVSDATWNGLRAGIASFLTASCKLELLGETMINASPAVIGAATVVAVNSIKYGILLYKGDISQSEYAERCLRDTVIISFVVLGTTVGQALIPIPILGGLIGNFIGGLMGAAIYQQGNKLVLAIAIEKGWTFLNFVNQNYTVPEHVLRRTGYQLFETKTFQKESFSNSSFSSVSFQANSIDIIALKRGVVGVRKIGYTT